MLWFQTRASCCSTIVASWARCVEGAGENGEERPVVDRLHALDVLRTRGARALLQELHAQV